MSRSNEIVSMLTAGVSLPRLVAPLILVALLTAAGSTALNYSLAPHAEFARKKLLEDPKSRRQIGLLAQIFRNRTDNRTWFIQQFKPGENVFTTVHIVQQDANDNIVKNYIATSALYHPETSAWELQLVKVVHYDETGNITKAEISESLMINDWSETPFRLSSANLRAEYILQERVNFHPVIETPSGPTKVEVRIMYLWLGELRPVNIVVRMGRGSQMGVDHNKGRQWVGGSAGLIDGSSG
jgi:lipopolysaccharide export LptBFGC system permease protein LptF